MSEYGFIGLGNMGYPMARVLKNGGHQVHVFDMNKDSLVRAETAGLIPCSSSKGVADRCETVFLSLPKGDNVLAAITAVEGIAQGAKVKRVVDFSTIGPAAAVKAAGLLSEKGIQYLDSPVSGGTLGAEKATLAIMTSCPRADYEAVLDALKVMGKPFYVGDKAGMAQTMKLANNMLSAGAMALSSEVFAMGVKNGLDPTIMLEVINAGSGKNMATLDKIPRAVIPRSFDIGFAAVLTHKDLKLCVDEGESLGIPMVISSAVKELYVMTISKFGQQADMSDVARLMESWAQVEIKRP